MFRMSHDKNLHLLLSKYKWSCHHFWPAFSKFFARFSLRVILLPQELRVSHFSPSPPNTGEGRTFHALWFLFFARLALVTGHVLKGMDHHGIGVGIGNVFVAKRIHAGGCCVGAGAGKHWGADSSVTHRTACGAPLALVPTSGCREGGVSALPWEPESWNIRLCLWLGSSVGSPFVRDLVRSSRKLTHAFWLWQPVWVRRDSCSAAVTHGEALPQSSGLGRKKSWSNISCDSTDLSSAGLECHLYHIPNLHVTCISAWTLNISVQ